MPTTDGAALAGLRPYSTCTPFTAPSHLILQVGSEPHGRASNLLVETDLAATPRRAAAIRQHGQFGLVIRRRLPEHLARRLQPRGCQ